MKKICVYTAMLLAGAFRLSAGETRIDVGAGLHYYKAPASLGRPFGTDPQRYQLLIPAGLAELRAGDRIVGIVFEGELLNTNSAAYRNFDVHICLTTAEWLQEAFDDNCQGGARQLVFERDAFTVDWEKFGWHAIRFDAPFEYAGDGHLLIEIAHDGGDSTFRTTRWSSKDGRILDSIGGGPGGKEAPMGIVREYFNNMQIIRERDDDQEKVSTREAAEMNDHE
ncbi:MAG: hypothetical protein EOM20_10725 [Spartobacteria bacterium]|nr:hypothetical protein [Spartobacteria bacterium]